MEKSQLTCPKCGSDNLVTTGTKGSKGKSIGLLLIFGPLVSSWIAKKSSDNEDSKNLQYKCIKCGNKFIPIENKLNVQEQVASGCKIIFHRDKSFVSAIVPQFVYLNGMKVGEVKNGKTIEFTTNVKTNTITVTDHFGVAFKDAYKFDTVEGEIIEIHFKHKFK